MNIFKKIILFLIITILTTKLIANFQTNISASSCLNSNNRKIANVAVLLYSFDDMYLSEIKQSLEAIQKNNEHTVNFTFFDSKQNKAIQNEILDTLLNKSFDLLILNLINPSKNELTDIVNNAQERSIPLIIFNIDPSIISQVKNIYNQAVFITTDSDQLGTLEGKILADEWNSNKNVIDKNTDNVLQYVILKGRPDTSAAMKRTISSISAIQNAGIKTQQLELIVAYWNKELAKNSIESLFLRYSNKIEAIISNNDAMAIGAIEALQKYGYNTGDRSKYISVVGIDGLQEAKDLIDKGLMTGTVTQSPNIIADAFYTIGLNLISNVNPVENTNYEIINGEIIIPENYQQYIKK